MIKEYSETLYKILFQHIREAIIFLNKTTIINANQAALDLFQLTEKELIGREIYEFTENPEEDIRRTQKTLLGVPDNHTTTIHTPSGEREIEVLSTPLDINGLTSYALLRDVTTRNRLQRGYKAIFEKSPDLILVTNQGGIVFINPKGVEFLGLSSSEEAIGKSTLNFIHPDYQELANLYAAERRAGGNPPSQYRCKMLRKDGKVLDVEFHASRIIWDDVPSSLTIARDISEQVRLEEELRKSNELLKDFIDSATDAFSILDGDMRYVMVNNTELEYTGRKREEYIGKHILDVFPDLTDSERYEGYKRVLETDEPIEYLDARDIPERGLKLNFKAFKVGDYLGIVGRDVSEQKKQEELLRRNREQLRAFMESATDGFLLLDSDLRVKEASQTWLTQAGLTREETIGKTLMEMNPGNDVKSRLNAYKKVASTGIPIEFKQVPSPRGDDRVFNLKAFKAGSGVGLISRDITEEVGYNKRLEQLHRLSDRLSAANSRQEIADTTVSAVSQILGCKRVSFSTIEEGKIVFHSAYPDRVIEELSLDRPSVITRAVNKGTPQLVQDTSLDSDYVEGTRKNEPPSLSEYAYPIKLHGRPVAVLNIEEPTRKAFTDQKINLVSILCDHVSAALHTQSYRDKLENMHKGAIQLSTAEALEEVYDITQNILIEILKYPWAGIGEVKENKIYYTRFTGVTPTGEPILSLDEKGVTVRAVKTESTQLVKDTRLDPDYVRLEGVEEYNFSELVVPVIIDNQVKLIINLESRQVDDFDENDVKLVELLANYVASAIHGITAINERKGYEERLRSLNRFGAEVDTCTSIKEIAELTMESVRRILHHSTGAFGVVKKNVIHFIELMGPTTTPTIPLDKAGITTRAVNTGLTQLVPDVRADQNYINGRVENEETLSELDVPIIVDGDSKGVINLESSKLNAFTSLDANLVEIMAEHVAAAMKNIQATEEKRRYREQLETLHRHSTKLVEAENIDQVADISLNALRNVFGFSYASFGVVKGGSLEFIKASGAEEYTCNTLSLDGPGVTVRSVKTGKTQYVEDTRLDPDYLSGYFNEEKVHLSDLAVPIKVDNKVVAILNIEDTELHAFSQEDIRLVELLVNHIVSALQRLRGYEKNLRYIQSLEALHNHAHKLAIATSYEEIGESTFSILENILGFKQGSFDVIQDDCVKAVYAKGIDIEEVTTLPIDGSGVVVRAVNTGKSQLVCDTRIDPNYIEAYVDGIQTLSELAVPVKADGKVVAVINLENVSTNSFTDGDKVLVEVMAQHVASNLERMMREEATREAERQIIIERERAEQAKRLEEMKTNFIRTATHEIRTPLTSIKGYTELASAKINPETDPSLAKYFYVIQRNTERLETLTRDLLDIQRIESGRIELNLRKLQLQGLVQRACTELRPILESKEQRLELHVEDATIVVDPTRLMQVLVNLIDNASKYSPKGSRIRVKAETVNDEIKLSITDEGVGLTEEDIPKLFNPFPDIERPVVTERSVGLGLSICKGIIELHCGEIWAESRGRNKGSTFTFTLPTSQSP
ncbi:GAF domain-containing protein [Candidatus Bathyarchaeota archaeon]|nr:GAF domain-containing protein [Candidatus Bathyarchaeota archaeon]